MRPKICNPPPKSVSLRPLHEFDWNPMSLYIQSISQSYRSGPVYLSVRPTQKPLYEHPSLMRPLHFKPNVLVSVCLSPNTIKVSNWLIRVPVLCDHMHFMVSCWYSLSFTATYDQRSYNRTNLSTYTLTSWKKSFGYKKKQLKPEPVNLSDHSRGVQLNPGSTIWTFWPEKKV